MKLTTEQIEVKKYNNSIDEQLLSIQKINASKLQQLSIDRKLADLAKEQENSTTNMELQNTKADFKGQYKGGINEALKSMPNISKAMTDFGIKSFNIDSLDSMKKSYNMFVNMRANNVQITEEEQKFKDYLLNFYTLLSTLEETKLKNELKSLEIDKE